MDPNNFNGFSFTICASDCNTDNLIEEYKHCIDNYMQNKLNDTKKNIRQFFKSKVTEVYLAVVFKREPVSLLQTDVYYEAVVIYKGSDQIIVACDYLVDSLKQFSDFIMRCIPPGYEKQTIDVTVHSVRDYPTALHNIVHLILNITEQMNLPTINFDNITERSFIYKLFVENTLICNEGDVGYTTKESVKKILISLNDLLDLDNHYQLPSNNLQIFSKFLISKNLIPSQRDTEDYKLQALNILVALKQRGQDVGLVYKSIKQFIDEYKDCYIREILRDNNKLKKKHNKWTSESLLFFIKCRADYLIAVSKLFPAIISVSDLTYFLNILGDHGDIDDLFNVKRPEIFRMKVSLGNSSLIARISKIEDKLKNIDNFIRFTQTKLLIINRCQVESIITLLYDKCRRLTKINVDNFTINTVNALIDIARRTNREDVTMSIIGILLCLPESHYSMIPSKFPLDFIKNVSQQHANFVMQFATLLKEPIETFALTNYLIDIIISNEEASIRHTAGKLLQDKFYKTLNSNVHKDIIDLEKLSDSSKYKSNHKFLKACEQHVAKRFTITYNCFHRLTNLFTTAIVVDIIRQIVEGDIQKIPKFFIKAFAQNFELINSDSNGAKFMLRLYKIFVNGKYIDAKNLEGLKDLLRNKDLIDEVAEIMRTVSDIHGRESIPQILIDEMKKYITHSKYVEYLMESFNANLSNELNILRNSRTPLEKRKIALCDVRTNICNHNPFSYKILETLVLYDSDLKYDVFSVLIELLPSGYNKKVSLNINKMFDALCDTCVHISDIKTLVEKDYSVDLSGVVNLLLSKISYEDEELDETLDLLLKIVNKSINTKLSDKQIKSLFYIAFSTQNHDLKNNVVEIISRKVSDLQIQNYIVVDKWVAIKEISARISSTELLAMQIEILKEYLQNKLIVTKDIWEFLLVPLNDSEQQNHHLEIVNLLLQVCENQKISKQMFHNLCNTFGGQPELLYDLHSAELIHHNLLIGYEIPDFVHAKISQIIQSVQCNKLLNLLLQILKISSNEIPAENLLFISNMMSNNEVNIHSRIICAEIISKEMPKNLKNYVIIQKLQEIGLEIIEDYHSLYFLVKKVVFKALEQPIMEDYEHFKEFLSNYYKVMCGLFEEVVCVNIPEQLQKYLNDESVDTGNKYKLLCSFSNVLAYSQEIDGSIFQSSVATWREKLLLNELRQTDPANKIELDKFTNRVNELKQELCSRNVTVSIEDILEILLDKQQEISLFSDKSEDQLKLKDINDLLVYLKSDLSPAFIKSLNPLQFTNDFKLLWLKNKLEERGIPHTEQNLTNLLQHLPFQALTIHLLFKHISNESVDELITFLKFLQKYIQNDKLIEQFILSQKFGNSSIRDLRMGVFDNLLKTNFDYTFLNYANYSETLHISKILHPNAYNQGCKYSHNSYRYTKKDIDIIANELKLPYEADINVLPAIEIAGIRTLHDCFKDAITTYSLYNVPTLLLVNVGIEKNHWINVVFIFHENKNFVLFKDSLGDHWTSKKQMKLIAEMLTPTDAGLGNAEHVENEMPMLDNVEFKFNSKAEQYSSHLGGVYALENMKIMAEEIAKDRNAFMAQFENYDFVKAEDVRQLYSISYPKLYVHRIVRELKYNIINHHAPELLDLCEYLKDRLGTSVKVKEANNDEETILVSIEVLDETIFDSAGYKYYYIIEQVDTFEFCDLFEDAIEYEQDDTTIRVVANNKFRLINLKEKLRMCEIVNGKIDYYLQEFAAIQPTEYYRNYLKTDLGLYYGDNGLSVKDYPLLYMLQENLLKLLKLGWTFSSIKLIVAKILNIDKLSKVLNGVNIIYEYNLREYDCNSRGIDVLSILKQFDVSQWEKEIHDVAIYQTFKGTYKKKLEDLKNELYNLNEGVSYLCDEKIYNDFNLVTKASSEKSILYPNSDIIRNWQIDLCREWAERVQDKHVEEVNIYEKLAVVKRVMTLHTRYELRDVQLFSLLLLYNCNEDSGRLLQINTGEGKTMIIAMLAVIKALEGNTVDIITSSSELASRQSVEQKMFYTYFKLDVDHIGASPINIKQRYKSHILYGAAPDFQGDVLRDEYNKMGTRNGRKFNVAIVDEVDSMFIDGKNHIVMLSSALPAMDYLEPILATIWIQIGYAADSILEKDGKSYYIEKKSIFNENGEAMEDIDIRYYPIVGTKSDFIAKAVIDYVKTIIGTSNDDESSKLKIPCHLRSFVTEIQLNHWIESAIYAKYKCQIDMHYILKNNRIVPIDASNTGVMQQNMRWQNGLHQFLQIKHGCKISPEGLTTNYLSNIAFFKRYGSNITGLSGTLGGEKSINLLKQVYNVDCVIVPPFKQKQYHELTEIVTNNKTMWYRNIANTCLAKVRNGRGVLVIMKYIREAEKMKTTLISQMGYDETKIKMYRTETDTNVISEELKAGEILIATNIAGRGTDIRPTDMVETNGGLHVCITFLPDNQRVEFQNIGRTSRTGNKGTAQFILLVENENEITFEQLKHERSIKEEKDIRNAMIEIDKVSDKDHVFNKFCELLNKVGVQNKPDKKVVKKAVEERFAIWLKLQENDLPNIEMNYNTFEEEILQSIIDNTVIQNPIYYIMFGNSFLEQKKYIEAITQYTKAISLDKSFTTNAFYNRGYAKLAQYGDNVKQNISLCQEAVADFKEAKDIIENNLEQPLLLIQLASGAEGISEQVSHKKNIYNVQRNTINKLIEVAEGAISKKRNITMERLDIYKSIPEDEDVDLYTDELDEYKNNGFVGNFKATEIKPIPWKTVISLALTGIGQLLAGAVLTIYTAGAFISVGWSMILAGVQDIFSAIKDGIINREFSWAAWLLDKAVSYTTTLICCGISSIKLAAEAVKDVATTVASKGTAAVVEACKTGWKTAAKLIGRGVVVGLAQQGATILVDYGVQAGVRPYLENSIAERLERSFYASLRTNGELRNLLEIDAKHRNKTFEKQIREIINNIVSETSESALGRTVISVSESISKVMNSASDSSIIENVQFLSLAGEIMKGVSHFGELSSVFIEKFNNEITALHDQVIAGQAEERRTEDSGQVNVAYFNPDDEDINLEYGNIEQQQVKLESKTVSLETVYDYFSKAAANSITDIVINKALLPLAHTGINYGTAKLGDRMKSASMNEIRNYYGTTSNMVQITEISTRDTETNNLEVEQLMSTSAERNAPVQIVDRDNYIVDIIGSDRTGAPIVVQNQNSGVSITDVTTNEVAAVMPNYGEVGTVSYPAENDTQLQTGSMSNCTGARINLVENLNVNVNFNFDFFRMSQ